MRLPFHRWAPSCLAIGITVACGSSGSNGLGGGDDNGGPAENGDVGSGQDDGGGSSGGSSGGFFAGGADGGGDAGRTIPITVTSIDTCTTGAPSGLSAASVKALLAGGKAGSMRFLYPYSG